ncbi:MAG: hypothetical protein DRQ55_17550 [Planctomycetota bacterium]|nr:MAG: hypothetical protein DRQ55_17550 [Planctomycetota bacterium]
MSDTATQVTSDVESSKVCDTCGSTFGEDDDKRFKDCSPCRKGSPEVADAPTVVDGRREEFEAVTIDVPTIELPKASPTNLYLCGVTMDAPSSYFTLGGVCFSKTEGEIRPDGDKHKMVSDLREGVVNALTEAQVDLVKVHVQSKIIRDYRVDAKQEMDSEGRTFTRTNHLGGIRSVLGQRLVPFVPKEDDKPIGCFVYMIRVQNRKHRPFEPGTEPTMVKRNW